MDIGNIKGGCMVSWGLQRAVVEGSSKDCKGVSARAKVQDLVLKTICWALVQKPRSRHLHMIKFGVLDLVCTINIYYKKEIRVIKFGVLDLVCTINIYYKKEIRVKPCRARSLFKWESCINKQYESNITMYR